MANDSHLFRGGPGPGLLPLWEAKFMHQFTHRYGDYALQAAGSLDSELPRPTEEQLANASYSVTPKYWVEAGVVQERLKGRPQRGWALGFRGIARSTDERTVIATVIPETAVSGKLPLLLSDAPLLWVVLANLNSFVLDWIARQKVGGTDLALFYVKQLPILPPRAFASRTPWGDLGVAEWLRTYVAELIFTSWDVQPLAREIGWDGPPFVWNRTRRRKLRAELDAAFFHLYELSRGEVDYVLDQFPIVRRNEERQLGHFATKSEVLLAFDAMAGASRDRPFTSALRPGPGDPTMAHPSTRLGRWSPLEVSATQGVGRQPERTSAIDESARIRTGNASRTGRVPSDAESSLTQLNLAPSIEGDAWRGEDAVDPRQLVLAQPVRHRTFGPGTIVALRPAGTGTNLLIRFQSGEREIAFGYGSLQFPRKQP